MKDKLILAIALFLSWVGAEKALAHGVKIQHNTTQAIEINARYDTGAPLENAQVTVYAPDDPTTPWKQGTTDERGNFVFTPDPSKTGYWEVKVRQAGHGGLTSIPLGTEANNTQVSAAEPGENQSQNTGFYSQASEGLSPVQKGIMIGSILWGCVGTALFFSKFNFKNSSGGEVPNVRQQESES